MSRKRGARLPIVSRLMLATCLLLTTIAGASLAADPNEPNDSSTSATDISYGYESVDTEIAPEGDVDFYRFSGSAGDVVEIRTNNVLASQLDGRLWLLDSSGVVLANNDDDDLDFTTSRLTAILPEDATYLIRYAYRSNQPGRPAVVANRRLEESVVGRLPLGSKWGDHRSSFRDSSAELRQGKESTGAYRLTVLELDPPPATRLIAGTGFAQIVPLGWSQPDVIALSGDPIVVGVERSNNGGTSFEFVSTVTETRFLDSIGSSGEEILYRVRIDYPDGTGSAFSEIVSAIPSAAGYRLSSPYISEAPTIDGSIDAKEWAEAVQVPLIDEESGSPVTTLYLMNNDDYLYLATDRPAHVAEIGIYFDTDNDDSFGFTGMEGNYWVEENREVIFRPIQGAYPDPEFGEFHTDPAGVTAEISISAARSQYEVRFDLKVSNLRGQSGDVIGVYVFDLSAAGEFAGHPPGPGEMIFIAPVTFADLTLGSPDPQIFLPATTLDFLDTEVGQDETHNVTVENHGAGSLGISNLQIVGEDEDHFEVRTTVPVVIGAGKSGQITVAFAPLAHGDFSASLQIHSNDPVGVSEVVLNGISVNQAPLLQVRNPVVRGIAGQSISIEAQCSDDLLLASVGCEYVTGRGTMGQVVLMQETGDIYRGAIPGHAIGADGLHYRVTAIDGESASSVTSYFEVTVETTRLESPALPGGSAQTAYRLVSIPSLLDDDGAGVFTGSFGPYDPKVWRLFGLDGGEYVEQSIRQRIAPGEALWLITRDGASLSSGPGESVPQSEPFHIPLEPGWTLVGHPFAYSVPPEQLSLGSGDTLDIRRYDESWSVASAGLVPWEGYAVFSESADELVIEPNSPALASGLEISTGADAMVEREALAKSIGTQRRIRTAPPSMKRMANRISPDADPRSWWIGVVARCQNAVDTDNVFGIHPEARIGRDSFDLPEPPPIGEYVSLYVPHPDWASVATRFCADIREPATELAWSLAVESNIEDRIELEFDLSAFPEGPLVWAMDQVTGVIWDLREQARFEIGPTVSGSREITLFVGDAAAVEDWADGALSGVSLSGESIAFPNPFQSAITIFYELPEAQSASVAIYGVNGELVRILRKRDLQAQGRHAVIWDGRDAAGYEVARGSYYYRVTGGSFSAAGRLILVD